MLGRKRFALVFALFFVFSMLLSACGGEAATPTTGTGASTGAATDTPAAAAAATDTPAAAAATDTPASAAAAATDTPAAMAGETPTSGTGGTGTTTFDPTKVKKLQVESGATLRITGWSSTPAEIQIVQDQIARFKQVYPDVQVNYEPTAGDYVAKFSTMVSAGTEPDVFYLQPQQAPDLMDAGRLLDLKPAMDEAGIQKTDYYEQLVNIFSNGDKIYGLPKDWGTLAFFYNTDMAKSAPPDGWNWDAYKKWVADNTTGTDKNTKVYGTMHQPDYARFVPFVLQNGGSVVSADGKSCAFNSQQAQDALTFYYGMIKDGTAGQASDVGASWPGEAFAKKRAVGVSEGGWLVPFVNDPKSGFNVNFKAVALPVGPTGTKGDLLFTNAYAATTKTKYPKAAAALVVFLSGEENERAVMETGFALPALKSFKGDPYFQSHPNDAVLFSALDYGKVDFYGPNNAKIDTAMNNALERVFRGQQDVKAALDQACSEIDPLLK